MYRKLIVSLTLPLILAGAAAQAQSARTPWGDPDLQGRWSNATLTPLQRPANLADKAFFTPDEAAAYVRERLISGNADLSLEEDIEAGNVGSYNDAWTDRGDSIVPTLRTSLIIDPPNGKDSHRG